MAEKVGSVYIDITAKMGSLEADLKALEGKLKSTDKQGSNLTNTFTKFATGLGVSAAVYKIVGAYQEAIKYGSKLQETQNKFNVVFSESKEQADAFAKNLVNAYGLATEESMAFLAGTGDILIGMGMASDKALELSNGVATLGIDLASFSNVAGGSERAIAALTSALTGEREALKAYGIVVNEELIKAELVATGKDKLTGMARKQAESEATLAIAYRQSGNAIGDMARSFDSYANIQRRVDSQVVDFQAMIGTMLIPSMSNLGLAFLGASKDGGIFGDVIKSITKYVATTINGIALLTSKIDEMRATSAFEDTSSAIMTNINYNKQLLKQYGGLAEFKAKATKDELAMYEANNVAINKNMALSQKQKQESEAKLNTLANLQKRIADEENGIVEKTVVKKKEATSIKVAEEQTVTAEHKKELEKRQKDIEMYGSVELAAFAERVNKINSLYSSVAGVATQLSGQLSQITSMEASNKTAAVDNELKEQQDALQAKYDAEVAAIDASSATEEEKAAKKKALDEQKARDEKNLTLAAEKEKRKIARDAAILQKKLSIFDLLIKTPQAAMSAYSSLAMIPFVGPVLGAAAAAAVIAMGAKQIQLVNDAPLPALAMGGIVPPTPGGNQFTIGEAGSAEAVIPLNDQTLGRLAGMINGAGGQKTNMVQLPPMSGENLYNLIWNASQNGELFISERAVVNR